MCGVAVALGAFGAHALKQTVEPNLMDTWRTATTYLMFHGVAVIALSSFATRFHSKDIVAPTIGIVIGALLFCGSLYAIVLGAPSVMGAITPIGGILWIACWLTLSYRFFKSTNVISHD
ncbi:MAG: DUF423 domain-containing protein [Gammaproteobacteria bacterium]|nr:DUF423 domain-containing protein [Gammaproteobacteria bacterium]